MAESVGDPEFHYDNDDGDECVISATMPGWGKLTFGPDYEGDFMLQFDDAHYMEARTLPLFIEWLQGLQSRLARDDGQA